MDTRQKIIQAAYQTFYRQGFHACGVELLAQYAGTTKRTLYAHFGSKDGLIAAVLDYRHTQFIAGMTAALDVQPDKPADAYLGFIRAWVQSPDFRGCLFLNACAEFPAHSGHAKQSAAHKQTVRRILRERLQRIGADAAQADYIFLIGEGLISAAQAGQSDVVDGFQVA